MKFHLTILIFLISISSFAQFSANDIKRLYKNNDNAGFIELLEKWNEPINNYENDTIRNIISLYSEIVRSVNKDDTSYFVLQKRFPEITIEGKQFIPQTNFYVIEKIGNITPLSHNIHSIKAIEKFIGKHPQRWYSIELRFKEKKNTITKLIYSYAKKRIDKYWERRRFTNIITTYPGLYIVKYISFSCDFKTAYIERSSDCCGERARYEFVNEKWKKKATLLEWEQ